MFRGPVVHVIAGALSGVLAMAASAGAQTSGDGFLLQKPLGQLAVRAGYDRAFAQSDVFRQDFRDLTLGRNDFAGIHLGADLSLHLGRQLDVVFGSTYAGSSADSRFRHYLDNNDLPIEQTTKLQRVSMTAGLREYLTPRGRSIGHFAWIPNRVAPYVAAGGGMLWARYQQDGDFVDQLNETNGEFKIFSTTYKSDKWTPTAHAALGADFTINPSLALTTEARYTYARAPLSRDFEGFDKIDLSGASVTAGLAVRF